MRKRFLIHISLWLSIAVTFGLWYELIHSLGFMFLSIYLLWVGALSIYIVNQYPHFTMNYLALTLCMPICGFMLALLCLRQSKQNKQRHETLHFTEVNYQIHMQHLSTLPFGAGGLTQTLMNESAPTEKRLNALQHLQKRINPETNLVLHQLLYADSDGVRIAAFKSLDQQQQKILSKLDDLASRQNQSDESIAELQWEQLYLHLCPKELRAQTLSSIYKYGQHTQLSPYGWFLKGKCALLENRLDEAQSYFDRASTHPQLVQKAIPFMADIHFRNRAYDKVNSLLKAYDTSHNHKMKAVASVWLEG